MHFIKSLLIGGFASTLLFSCKDAGSKPTTAVAAEAVATTAPKAPAVPIKPETASFKITGMTCAIGCAGTIQKKLSGMNGVQKATVDFDKKEATVDYDATVLNAEKLTKAVETTGDGETYKVSGMQTKSKT